ncbi:purine nucleoside permease [Flexithrix dorotheae]|uniref:purine nucleoside permease n=1 Tax=Flexithrix dorotheae TaxID=70993 RepID=UPI000380B5CE|nr:purine nucleoside permease [Flexithrix dorotheae]
MLLFLNIISCDTSLQNKNESSQEKKIPIKVVVISMFELGEDEGDRPGEFQFWVERIPLNESIGFPVGNRNLRLNREKGILGICTGIGSINSAASIMALGLDERFDLSKAYFIVAGISGIDPEDASTGSAVWAEWLVDGDLSHEIDGREIPQDWTTGYIPLRKKKPFEKPLPEDNEGAVFRLDPDLVEWAYQLTKQVELIDNEEITKMRSQFKNFPNAQKPPQVLKGDHLAAMTYWHGELMNTWANDWVSYWSNGKGNFVTSAMEDTGTMSSLLALEKGGKVDSKRFLVLRTASNFTMQHEGITASQSLSGENLEGGGYSAFIPSLEAAWLVGSKVIFNITDNWNSFEKGFEHLKNPN